MVLAEGHPDVFPSLPADDRLKSHSLASSSFTVGCPLSCPTHNCMLRSLFRSIPTPLRTLPRPVSLFRTMSAQPAEKKQRIDGAKVSSHRSVAASSSPRAVLVGRLTLSLFDGQVIGTHSGTFHCDEALAVSLVPVRCE